MCVVWSKVDVRSETDWMAYTRNIGLEVEILKTDAVLRRGLLHRMIALILTLGQGSWFTTVYSSAFG